MFKRTCAEIITAMCSGAARTHCIAMPTAYQILDGIQRLVVIHALLAFINGRLKVHICLQNARPIPYLLRFLVHKSLSILAGRLAGWACKCTLALVCQVVR